MTRTLTLALALALTACGGKGDDDTDGTDGATNAGGGGAAALSAEQQWYQDYAYLACQLAYDCVGGTMAQQQYDACIQAVDAAVQWWPEGLCDFDQAAAQECMDWLETIDCDGWAEGSEEPEACELAWDCPE